MKRFYTLFLLLALCGIASHAGLVPQETTVWQENFQNAQGDVNNCLNNVYPDPEFYNVSIGAWDNYNNPCLMVMGDDNMSAHADFKHENSNITDNWTLSFNIIQEDDCPDGLFKQLAIIGSKTNISESTILSNGYFAALNKTNDIEENGIFYSVFDVMLGNTKKSENLRLSKWGNFIFTLQCTGLNSTSATAHLTIEQKSDTKNQTLLDVTENIDPSAIGDLRGFYNYLNNEEIYQYTIVKYDNFLLTKTENIDDTPCSEPTYEIVGAYNTARLLTLGCSTDGADIYYSENQLETGAEGWTKYTGEQISTSSPVLYAYAYNSANKTTSNIIEIITTADGKSVKIDAPLITLQSYDEETGYAFTITPQYEYTKIVSQPITIHYTIDGGTEQTIAENEVAHVTPGATIKAYVTADGYQKSGQVSTTTSYRPSYPLLWSQDFTTLVDASAYGTDKKSIGISDIVAFKVETKDVYNINKFINEGQNVNVKVDSRIALSTATDYYLQATQGIVSTKMPVEPSTDEEGDDNNEDYLANYDGIAVSGLLAGQYVFVTTTGGQTQEICGCSKFEGASTQTEQIYVATSDKIFINIPNGISIKDIRIYSDKEAVTTNEYGIATYVSVNPVNFEDLDFEGTEGAYIVEEETKSGKFNTKKMTEVPAGTPIIIIGKPNTQYVLSAGYASILDGNNLLQVSSEDINVSNYDKPIYTVDMTNGDMQLLAEGTVPAGTPYILSELDVAKFISITIGASKVKGLVYGEPLDFKDVEGLTAVTITGESLSDGFEEYAVTDIPAETPVILKGEPGTYKIQIGTRTEELEYTNKLAGNTKDDFTTNSIENAIYILSEEEGKMVIIDKSAVMTIPAGTIYLPSRYRGFVDITTNASGTLSMTSNCPLDFTESSLKAYIVTGETVSATTQKEEAYIPAGTPFLIENGEPNTKYTLVKASDDVKLDGTNMLISSTTDYAVNQTEYYVYALNATNGKFERMEEDYIVPAGEAYYISQYKRPINLGSVDIEMPENGVRTYITANALDFEVVDGLKAHIVTSEEYSEFITEQVYKVPENTALVLRGTPGETYKVPIIESAEPITNNMLRGSLTEPFDVSTETHAVYAISKTSTYIEFTKVASDLIIPEGKAYIISDYLGFEKITINAKGYASYFTNNPLDFTNIEGIEVRIVTGETPNEIITKTIKQTTKDCAIIIKGEPGKTYTVPIGTLKDLGCQNLLQGSHTDDFEVKNAWGYVYALSSKTGELTRVSSNLTIGKGKAYFVSEYAGKETITTNAKGMASLICDKPLDFESIQDLKAYVINMELIDGYDSVEVVRIPAGEAFYVVGEPNTTYKVPVRKCETLAADNILEGSLTDSYPVSNAEGYFVYALSEETGKFTKLPENAIIPARTAYFISQFRGFETVKLNNIGVGTWVSAHPLDFNSVRNFAAYIVSSETETTTQWKWVTQVPANTPFIMRGVADSTYNIPIGDLEEWDEINLLSGSVENPYIVPESERVYALSGKTGMLTKVAAGLKIEARKAYLISTIANSAESKAIRFIFEEEETTVVEEISCENSDNKTKHHFYNFAGQPVDDDYKGLVIDEHGRKYLRQ